MAIGNTKFKVEHGLEVVGNTEIGQSLKVLGTLTLLVILALGELLSSLQILLVILYQMYQVAL